jgi:hypothetical protein
VEGNTLLLRAGREVVVEGDGCTLRTIVFTDVLRSRISNTVLPPPIFVGGRLFSASKKKKLGGNHKELVARDDISKENQKRK